MPETKSLFDTILGQEDAKGLLKRSLASGRIAPTYIFHGPEGVGKRLTAKLFAAAMNCQTAPGLGCGRCGSCQKIMHDQHPDVNFYVPEVKDIKIETIREIQQLMGLKRWEASWRFFVLDGANQLNDASSNCLLKILEEPSPNSSLILLCENPRGLLPTIRSRSQQVAFHPIPVATLADHLAKHGFEESHAASLARASLGRMSRVEELRDPETMAVRQDFLRALETIQEWTPAAIVKYAEKLVMAGKKQGRDYFTAYFEEIILWCRDVVWLKGKGDQSGLFHPESLDALLAQAKAITATEAAARLEWSLQAIALLKRNVHTELALDVTLLKQSGRFPGRINLSAF